MWLVPRSSWPRQEGPGAPKVPALTGQPLPQVPASTQSRGAAEAPGASIATASRRRGSRALYPRPSSPLPPHSGLSAPRHTLPFPLRDKQASGEKRISAVVCALGKNNLGSVQGATRATSSLGPWGWETPGSQGLGLRGQKVCLWGRAQEQYRARSPEGSGLRDVLTSSLDQGGDGRQATAQSAGVGGVGGWTLAPCFPCDPRVVSGEWSRSAGVAEAMRGWRPVGSPWGSVSLSIFLMADS